MLTQTRKNEIANSLRTLLDMYLNGDYDKKKIENQIEANIGAKGKPEGYWSNSVDDYARGKISIDTAVDNLLEFADKNLIN